MMKDENNGKVMNEFVGLGAKMYSFTVDDGTEVKKAKGIKKCVVSETNINDYKDCLFNHTTTFRSMLTFKSKLHVIYTYKLKKILFSHKDTKRKIKSDQINTYAWSHYKIMENSDTNINYSSHELDMLIEEMIREGLIND